MTESPWRGLAAEAESVNEALHLYGAAYAQVGRAFAAREGLHSTDATALIEILAAEEAGAPLSPAKLSERIGLSFGATSTLLNRLETVGHITRSRTHSDRRIVTLHSTPDVQALADAFFDPLGQRLAQKLGARSPRFLQDFASLLNELRIEMLDYVAPDPGNHD